MATEHVLPDPLVIPGSEGIASWIRLYRLCLSLEHAERAGMMMVRPCPRFLRFLKTALSNFQLAPHACAGVFGLLPTGFTIVNFCPLSKPRQTFPIRPMPSLIDDARCGGAQSTERPRFHEQSSISSKGVGCSDQVGCKVF